MAEETIGFVRQLEIILTKIWPYLFLGGLFSSVKLAALINNGIKIGWWKMFTSTFIAVVLSGMAGFIVEDLVDAKFLRYAIVGGVAIMGEKLLVWLAINSDKVLGDIWSAVLGRFGYRKSDDNP